MDTLNKGYELVKLRKEYGLTQPQFAEFAGVSHRTVMRYEAGKSLKEKNIEMVEIAISKLGEKSKTKVFEPAGTYVAGNLEISQESSHTILELTSPDGTVQTRISIVLQTTEPKKQTIKT